MAAPVDVPVLQVHGEDDALLPVAQARRSAAHTTGPYRWSALPGAGHYPTAEQPAAVTDVLLDWLADLP